MRYLDAYAEWDDRDGTFRVYLLPENTDDATDSEPLEARVIDAIGERERLHARLYRAAFCKNPKDFQGEHARLAGWPKRLQAERAAKAVKAELGRIEKGEPGPTDMAVQIAVMLAKPRRR